MNIGGNAVVLAVESSYTQNKKMGKKTRIKYQGGQYVMYMWVPPREEDAQE